MARTFKIATRRSKMALAQTRKIIQALQAVAPEHRFEPYEVVAQGDYDQHKGDLKQIGGKGAFVKSLEVALLNDEADMAMHSMKDVPGDIDLPEGLVIPAMLARDDVRDAIVCRVGESLVELKAGSKVGTSSVRRAAQLRIAFPHLSVVPLRGNADTRIAKVDSGEVDAAVLAMAGLQRIGLEHRVCEVLEPDIMVPCVGQGVVGIECKQRDAEVMGLLAQINHGPTFALVTAERAMLMVLQGSCHTPIGGYSTLLENGTIQLVGMVSSLDGTHVVRAMAERPAAEAVALGRAVANDLLSQGAAALIAAVS